MNDLEKFSRSHTIKEAKLKQPIEFSEKANIITDFLKFPETKYTKVKKIIYGSYAIRAQPYPGDIDSVNIVIIKLPRKESIKYVVEMLKKKVKTIMKHKNWFLTDVKAGLYDDGEPIHWKPKEILQGYRNGNVPDFKGHIGNKKLSDAVQEDTKIKLDLVVPYYGLYREITVIYFISDNDGPLNYRRGYLKTDSIVSRLKKDAKKEYDAHHFLKASKRLFSQARIKKDYYVVKKLYPIISSDISKLSSIASDLKTLLLLLKEDKKINIIITNQEINNMIDKISTLLNVHLNRIGIIESLHKLNILLRNKKINESIELLGGMVKYLDEVVNDGAKQFLEHNNLIDYLND